MSILLGLGYKASCGKDTSGDYLKNIHGWNKIAFADNLKNCLSDIFGLTKYQLYSTEGKETPFKVPFIYTYLTHKKVLFWMETSLGTDIYNEIKSSSIFLEGLNIPHYLLGKKLYTPRQMLQFVGTDIMRFLLPDYHLITCLKCINPNNNTVITDVRFPNEGSAINTLGGFCVKINRDSYFLCDKDSNHESEKSMDDWGGWYSSIDNNGSFDNLYESVDKIVENITNGVRRQCS